MTEGEDNANSERMKWAKKRSGKEEAYLRTTALDEARHKKALQGLKDRL